MGLFKKNKKENEQENKKNEIACTINVEVGKVDSYAVLAGGQLSSFIAELANEKNDKLKKEEIDAFDTMWNAFCIGGEFFKYVKKGSYPVRKDADNGITIAYEKNIGPFKDQYEDSCRTTIYYTSNDGNIVFKQHDLNRNIVLIYISKNINPRLKAAIDAALCTTLKIVYDNDLVNSIESPNGENHVIDNNGRMELTDGNNIISDEKGVSRKH